MTNEESKLYYKTVLNAMLAEELLASCDTTPLRSREELSEGMYHELYTLLDQVEHKYEFDLQKNIATNHTRFTLWQQYFCGNAAPANTLAATRFVIFCCLADKILDSNRFSLDQKEAVCKKLHSQHFFSERSYESQNFPELDILLNQIRIYLLKCNLSSKDRDELEEHMRRAFNSEIFMYRYPLKKLDAMAESDLPLLIDKSVEFELSASLIAGPSPYSPQMVKAATCIGRIMWIIDDLWDLPEDAAAFRRNSFLFFDLPLESCSIKERIHGAQANIKLHVDMLVNDFQSLKKIVNSTLFNHIRWIVCKWSRHISDARR